MGTIVGVRARDGVVLAADRRATEGSTVRSDDVRKLVTFDDAAAALEGAPGDVQAFARQLDVEVTRLETRQETAIRITALARLASRLAEETGVEALVSARDADRIAQLRAVDGDGGTFDETVAAWGTGAEIALGVLETVDGDAGLDEVASTAERAFETITERDAATGGGVDVWQLDDR